MKYLLPIDVPALDDGRHLCNECPIWNKEHLFCEYDFNMNELVSFKKGCPLKPMPQKKEVEVNEIEDIMHTEYSIEDIYTNKYIVDIRLATDKLISLGWNYCLEELEK